MNIARGFDASKKTLKVDKLKKYETKVESPITENEHRANLADMVELLMPLVEKVKNLPPSNFPLPTWAELIDELKNGSVYRQPVILNSGVAGSVAVRNPADDTCIDSGNNTFTESELLILEELKK